MSNLPTITAEKASEIPLFKSWDDLTTRVITVVIQMPYADPNGKPRAYRLPLCTPTYHEFYSIRGQVPEPNIPRTGIGANGQPVPNPLDNTYLKQKAEAEEERDLRLLIFCLEKAGINVPGEDIPDKIKTMKETMDSGITHALVEFVKLAVKGGTVRLVALADDFRE